MPDPVDTPALERFRALLARLLRVPKQEVLEKERARRTRRAVDADQDEGRGEGG